MRTFLVKFSFLLLMILPPIRVSAEPIVVRSPDGVNAIALSGLGKGEEALGVRVTRGERGILSLDAFLVRLAEGGLLSGAATMREVTRSTVDETFTLPWGKAKAVRHHGERATIRLINAEGIVWEVDLAAYDDGVAYRYRLPAQDGLTAFTIMEERGDLTFSGTPTIHYTSLPNFTTSHEMEFQRGLMTAVTGPLVDLPLLAVWPDGVSAGLTEASVRNFPNLMLAPDASPGTGVLHPRLSPLPKGDGACVIGEPPLASPWRAVFLGDSAGKLLESNLLLCLNDGPASDFSWAKPGKSTWNWWNGTLNYDPGHMPGMNLETHKRYIDFCAQNGIEYHAVVADSRPWYVQSRDGYAPGPDTDILTPRPELRFQEILDYAKAKGVHIRLWVHWTALEPVLEEAFQQYEDWGVAGLMVDFLDRDDQEMVDFCERVLESAARHRLHVQFHGSYKPSGEQRTYPNLFNREGVLNLEYLKWSDRCTPPHNVEAAYVRQLAGLMDYHTGGFNAVSREDFVARNEYPYVLGTRCHHLSMYVVYDNPMPMVSDAPETYERQMGFDFIAEVPTTWDETHFVAGEAGEWIVMARRSGATWYLGGMGDWKARDVAVPLDFLGEGRFTAQLYVDGSMDEAQPNAIRAETKRLTAMNSLHVAFAPGGGFVAVISPR